MGSMLPSGRFGAAVRMVIWVDFSWLMVGSFTSRPEVTDADFHIVFGLSEGDDVLSPTQLVNQTPFLSPIISY